MDKVINTRTDAHEEECLKKTGLTKRMYIELKASIDNEYAWIEKFVK